MNEHPATPLETVALWTIEAAESSLVEACEHAAVDPNALRRGTEFDPCRLTYPNFFCKEPQGWLAVLAYLAGRGERFRLYLVEASKGDTDRVVSLVRLFPRIDEQMLEMLGQFNPHMAQTADHLAARVEQAFACLLAESRETGRVRNREQPRP